MSQTYERPRRTARIFGAGLLTGNGIAGGDLVTKLQDNVKFRIDSARQMLMGGGSTQSMKPLDRRRQIRQRRLDAFNLGNIGGNTSGGGSGNTSGNLGETSNGSSTNSNATVSSGTPTMSEVGGTTREKAGLSG